MLGNPMCAVVRAGSNNDQEPPHHRRSEFCLDHLHGQWANKVTKKVANSCKNTNFGSVSKQFRTRWWIVDASRNSLSTEKKPSAKIVFTI